MRRISSLVLVAGFVVSILGATAGTALAVAPTSAPTGLSPSSGDSVSANHVLSWGAVSGAVKYRVVVSTAPNFSVTTYTVDTQELRATPTVDLPLGTLYWRVAGMDSSSALGPWADTQFNKTWNAAPEPQYPLDMATLAFPTDPLRFTWLALPGALSYELQVDDAADFIGAASYPTKSTSYVITEPKTSGQTFYWRVRGISSTPGIVSDWSATHQASVVWPGTPTLVYPADGATIDAGGSAASCPDAQVLGQALGCDLYFEWSPVLGAKTYQVQVSPNTDWANNVTIDATVKDTRYAPYVSKTGTIGNLNNGNYYWRVRALDAASPQDFGPWSDANVLAIDFTRAWSSRPVLVAPANGNVTLNVPTFTWMPIDHAAWYQLDISSDINFGTGQTCYTNRTTFTPYSSAVGIGINPPGTCNVFPLPGVTYYWHVRGIDGPVLNPGVGYTAGILGLWSNTSNSDVWSFVYKPSMPAYVAPADGATVEVPTLKWSDAPGATKYKVTVIKQSGLTAVTSPATYSTSWTPPTLDPTDSPFRWFVQAYDQNNQLSLIPDSGSQRTFTLVDIATTYSTPDPISPADGASSYDMPALVWQPVTGATSYQVWYGVQGSGAETQLGSTTDFPAFTYPTDVKSSGTYFWYVKAYGPSGFISDSSASLRTFVIPQLDLLAPGDYLTPAKCAAVPCTTPEKDTATLTWNAVPGAFAYTVYVSADQDFTNVYRTYTTTFTRLSPRDSWLDNQANQAYYWFVRPARSGNTGRFDSDAQQNASDYQKKSEGIHLNAPANAASVADEVTFSWQDFLATNQGLAAPVTQEAKQYRIQVSTVADFATTFDDKTVDQTSFTEYDRTYPEGPLYWRVQAIDGSGNALTWSETRPLTKSSPAVSLTYPAADATVAGVPFLQWNPQGFAASYDVQIAKNGDDNFSSPNQVILTNTGMSAYAYTDALAAGDYAWHVRRVDADGRTGPWSSARKFHLVPVAPSLVSPVNGAATKVFAQPTFVFQWTSTQSYPRYTIETSTTSNFAVLKETHATVMMAWAPTTLYAIGTYYWRVKAMNASSVAVATSDVWSFTVAESGATYVALPPARLLDTRNGTGLSGPFGSHAARSFQVAGLGGVPSNATAVTGNLTVTGQTSNGYLFLGPSANNSPTSSTLNFPIGDDRANGVTVALGTGGTLGVTFVAPKSGPTAHVIFDVTGYFVPDTSGATFLALNPARVLDTRSGTGLAGPSGSHEGRTFQVSGNGGVPAGATAVTGNLTVTGQTSPGYLFLGPVALNDPTSSTLNFPVGDDRANGVTVALGGGGTLGITFVAPHPGPVAHVIFDVTGYFVPNLTGASYVPLNPARLLDTRSGNGLSGPFGSHAARAFGVANRGGVPATATAVTGNLTVTAQTSSGYLFIGPVAVNDPTSSTLNFPVGDDRANGVTVALGGGSLGVTLVAPNPGPTAHVIFDVTGYFVP